MKILNQISDSLKYKKNAVPKEKPSFNKKDYFQLAATWSDDYYTTVAASRNRYKLFCFILAGISGVLLLSTLSLVHTHEYIPLLVHHYDSGAVSVEPVKQHYAPESQAEVEGELVRYVVNRESYDPTSFSESYQLVHVMSDNMVANQYVKDQNGEDDRSFIHRFSDKTIRSVKIEDVNFLDNEELNEKEKGVKNHKNLAEINFIVTDRSAQGGQEKRTHYVAIISWAHTGIPNDPEIRWMNWDGFMVTSYQVNQRTVS
jgi:type IV secretion system protein VirB8